MRILLTAVWITSIACAQKGPAWTAAEQPIADEIRTLRKVPDSERGETTRQLALRIRNLPNSPRKLNLATGLAHLSTEGDFGHNTLQEVASTLAAALRESPSDPNPYQTLAQLVRYEGVSIPPGDPNLEKALRQLEADDLRRASADFTLPDLNGKQWTLSSLRGKVVLVNFWATWCPPCRKEIPDLAALYSRFHKEGFVILAISEEQRGEVQPFVKEQNIPYPILLDEGRKVNERFAVDGIPKSFIYDRSGKLAATAIDMRTRKQFLALLAKAGLE